MKYILFAAVLFPSVLFAQQPPMPPGAQIPPVRRVVAHDQEPADVFPDNYQVTLTVADKDTPPVEVFVVVASSQFLANFSDQSLALNGSLNLEDSGNVLVRYNVSWQTQNSSGFVQSSTQGSIRLKLGEEVPIVKSGTRTIRLAVKKLEPAKSK